MSQNNSGIQREQNQSIKDLKKIFESKDKKDSSVSFVTTPKTNAKNKNRDRASSSSHSKKPESLETKEQPEIIKEINHEVNKDVQFDVKNTIKKFEELAKKKDEHDFEELKNKKYVRNVISPSKKEASQEFFAKNEETFGNSENFKEEQCKIDIKQEVEQIDESNKLRTPKEDSESEEELNQKKDQWNFDTNVKEKIGLFEKRKTSKEDNNAHLKTQTAKKTSGNGEEVINQIEMKNENKGISDRTNGETDHKGVEPSTRAELDQSNTKTLSHNHVECKQQIEGSKTADKLICLNKEEKLEENFKQFDQPTDQEVEAKGEADKEVTETNQLTNNSPKNERTPTIFGNVDPLSTPELVIEENNINKENNRVMEVIEAKQESKEDEDTNTLQKPQIEISGENEKNGLEYFVVEAQEVQGKGSIKHQEPIVIENEDPIYENEHKYNEDLNVIELSKNVIEKRVKKSGYIQINDCQDEEELQNNNELSPESKSPIKEIDSQLFERREEPTEQSISFIDHNTDNAGKDEKRKIQIKKGHDNYQLLDSKACCDEIETQEKVIKMSNQSNYSPNSKLKKSGSTFEEKETLMNQMSLVDSCVLMESSRLDETKGSPSRKDLGGRRFELTSQKENRNKGCCETLFLKKLSLQVPMFNTLSNNESVPKGKKVLTQSVEHRQSHFEAKDPNYKPPYQTINQYFYPPKERVPNERKSEHTNASHFNIGEPKTLEPSKHFMSETKQQYAEIQNPQRAKQVRDKAELLKTTYSLGEEQSNYHTTFNSHFYDKSSIKVPEMRLKKPERYNIITNKDMPPQMLSNASNFDFWNQDRSKSKTSNNLTDHPMYGVKIDPITNRILPTSKGYPHKYQ